MNRLMRIIPCWLVAMVVAPRLGVAQQAEQNTEEQQAWESAATAETPSAFLEYFHKYPDSPRIRTRTGTVRGRYWYNVTDKSKDGVIVTVEGMNVLLNVSLEEAVRLKVIGARSHTTGSTFRAEGTTFNYVYGEVVKGGMFSAGMSGIVIEPRDHLNSTVVLSADETRLLTWDLSKAEIATQPNPTPTFIDSFATMEAFSDLPPGLNTEVSPKSQSFTVTNTAR